jgi:hypothetical protein
MPKISFIFFWYQPNNNEKVHLILRKTLFDRKENAKGFVNQSDHSNWRTAFE